MATVCDSCDAAQTAKFDCRVTIFDLCRCHLTKIIFICFDVLKMF